MSITGAPHDGVLAAALILVGALAALAGLWMLLRRRENRAVSAAVFAAGAGLLVLPWVQGRVAEPPPAPPEPVSVGKGIVISPDGLRTVAAPNPASRPPPLPGRTAATIDIEATEAEPNDNLAAANAAGLGTAIEGTLTAGDTDYFAVDVPAEARGDIVASLLVLEGDAGLTFLDDAGKALGSADTIQQLSVRATTLERHLDRPRYYVLVRGGPQGAAATYQLTIATRRR